MEDAKQKGISLRPGKVDEHKMIIDRILGPGLTVVGCELASYRHALMRQMAIAIATGNKFLNTFAVKKETLLAIRIKKRLLFLKKLFGIHGKAM